MSVDAKGFAIPDGVLRAGDTTAKLTFGTSGDTYLPQALAFSVPLPDIVVRKTVRPKRVHPGGKVHYTITVTNRGGVGEPHATVTDDLSDVIDDARYDGHAHATRGQVAYHRPRLTWHGDLPAGATATITYTATARRLGHGNGRMRNAIVSSYHSECPRSSTDPRCRAATVEVPRGKIKERARR
jgi:uncharacterized repeat protein (TIGR01451 family)